MALTKDQLIQDIAEAIDAQKTTVRSALDQLAEIVKDALENDGEITLPGIGKLKVSERPARTGRNPQTGKAIEIAAKRVAKFVPAKALFSFSGSRWRCRPRGFPPDIPTAFAVARATHGNRQRASRPAPARGFPAG